MERRLYRSEHERMLTGVCGGIAEYFDVDPTLIRILFVVAAVVSAGVAILGYVALAIIMPKESQIGKAAREVLRENLGEVKEGARTLGEDLRSAFRGGEQPAPEAAPPVVERRKRRRWGDPWVIGAILIGLGVIFLLESLNLFWWWQFGRLWPLILIAIGVLLLVRRNHAPRRREE